MGCTVSRHHDSQAAISANVPVEQENNPSSAANKSAASKQAQPLPIRLQQLSPFKSGAAHETRDADEKLRRQYRDTAEEHFGKEWKDATAQQQQAMTAAYFYHTAGVTRVPREDVEFLRTTPIPVCAPMNAAHNFTFEQPARTRTDNDSDEIAPHVVP